MPSVAVLILNWNGKDFLERFLPALITHTPSGKAEIIIADNGSTDNSCSWIKDHYPHLRIIKLSKNHGFAEGYNLAIEACGHDSILLLNSDVEVSEGWLEPLIDSLNNSKTGAVMPKILSWHKKEFFEYAGAAGGFIDKY